VKIDKDVTITDDHGGSVTLTKKEFRKLVKINV
jgi:hypothetical protein